MTNSLWAFLLVTALAVGLGIVNGWNDAANSIATVIGTRVLRPRTAIIMAAVLNLVGSATGLQVAKTIGKGVLIPEAISYEVAIAALLSIVIWGVLATLRGLPISLTHGLVAGLVGAGIATIGTEAVLWTGIIRVILLAVVVAPLCGFMAGFIVMVAMYWILRKSHPARVTSIFSKLQIISAAFMSYTHGLNDGQNAVAFIVVGLVLYTGDASLWNHVPLWTMLLSAAAIAFGTAAGGTRVIKTLGVKIAKLQPVHGFAAEVSAAGVIEVASLLGIPISTTHCITTAIMGVMSVRRFSAVRWGLAREIVTAWIITFPLCGGLGYLFGLLLKTIF